MPKHKSRRVRDGQKTGASKAELEEKLSECKQIFCRAYIRYKKPSVAYHIAYPDALARTCNTNGSRYLNDPDVLEYISLLREEDRAVVDFERHDALRLLLAIAENPYHKQQREAINDVWEKLGLGEATRKGNWFDGLERLAELVRATEKKQ